MSIPKNDIQKKYAHNDINVSILYKDMYSVPLTITKSEFIDKFKSIVNEKYITEVRIIKKISKFFDCSGKLYDFIENYNGLHAIYWTINPCDDNKLNDNAACNVNDIICRKFIFIDIDPIREKNISSTQEQLVAAYEKQKIIQKFLDWGKATVVMSGNGYHLFYKCDLPNNDDITDLLRTFLHYLSDIFSDDICDIDTSVFNASRISKIPYTISLKGKEHRETYIVEFGSNNIITEKMIINIIEEMETIIERNSITTNKKSINRIETNVIGNKILLDSDLELNLDDREDFNNALNKSREWLKSLYNENKIFSVRKGQGRRLSLAIMAELKANGLKYPYYACKWMFGSEYNKDITKREWKKINGKAVWRSETLCKSFPEFCNRENTIFRRK